ncbi:hypothetical protein [Azospirillum argentinense]|nr:hypothetical protein [Azospirillum argentinense]
MNDDATILPSRPGNSAPFAAFWHIVYGIHMPHDWYTESTVVAADR